MTRFSATEPRERLSLVAEAVTAHRERASDGAVFETGTGDDPPRVTYADRTIELHLSDAERERLDALLGEFPVFKVKQPDTRKSPEGVVVLSAIADPKHAADFVERTFREVFACDGDYELWAAAV